MTEDSTHVGPNEGDPARRGAQIGVGLVPDEVIEGEAESQAAGRQPDDEPVEPGRGDEPSRGNDER